MKNYFILTLGTRDVQLRWDLLKQSGEWTIEELEDPKSGRMESVLKQDIVSVPVIKDYNERFPNHLLIPPRKGAKIVYEHLPLFRPFLDFPIIGQLIEEFKTEGKSLTNILLIYTNQQNVGESFSNNDTLYFKEILARILEEEFPEATIENYGIVKEVVNIDYQYRHFAEEKKSILSIPEEEIGEILLLPQGGIDQINQAITLQLIQAFGHKVKLYQKAEKAKPLELKFTKYFINDLINHQVMALVNGGNFQAALELRRSIQTHQPVQYELQNKLLLFAHYRISLLYEESRRLSSELVDSGIQEALVQSASQTFSNCHILPNNFDSASAYKVSEVLEKARYCLKENNIGEAILFYYVHFELLLNGCLDAHLGTNLTIDHQSHQKYALRQIENQYPNVYAKYQRLNKAGNVYLTSPVKIDVVLAESGFDSPLNYLLKGVSKYVNSSTSKGQLSLNDARNKYAHEGRFIKISEVPYFPNLVNNSAKAFQLESEDQFTRLIKYIQNTLMQTAPYTP